MHVFEKEGLITDDRIGREKYYYLLKDGEAVYKEIKSRKSMINLPLHERQWENNDLTNIIMRVTNNVEPILTVNPVINYASHGIQNSFRIINDYKEVERPNAYSAFLVENVSNEVGYVYN